MYGRAASSQNACTGQLASRPAWSDRKAFFCVCGTKIESTPATCATLTLSLLRLKLRGSDTRLPVFLAHQSGEKEECESANSEQSERALKHLRHRVIQKIAYFG